MFADRLESAALADVREFAEAGEWECEIDLLIACLRSAPVTAAERAELTGLPRAMGLSAGPAEAL